jgi:hypothetical protein
VGQQRILLRFVEAMDFIDEEDGAAALFGAQPPRTRAWNSRSSASATPERPAQQEQAAA